MELRQLVEKLRNAKRNKQAWLDIALTFREIGRTQGGLNLEREAAEASGYTVGVLRRFVVVMEFLESDAFDKSMLPPKRVLETSFTAVEQIQRIARLDPERAKELIADLSERSLRIDALRDEYAQLQKSSSARLEASAFSTSNSDEIDGGAPIALSTQSFNIKSGPRSVAALQRRSRAEKAFRLIGAMLPDISGNVERFDRPTGIPSAPLRCDAIAWLDVSFKTGDGFEIVYAPAAMTEVAFSDQVSRAIVAAMFFRRHFIVFTDDSDRKFISKAERMIADLDLRSVGLLALGDMQRPVRVRPPDNARPEPDRRHLLFKLCPKGRWASDSDA